MKNVLSSHFILGFVQAVSQGSRCGLVDHTQDIQASDLPGVFGGLESDKYTVMFSDRQG